MLYIFNIRCFSIKFNIGLTKGIKIGTKCTYQQYHLYTINLFYIIFCEVILRKLFLLKLYCLFKLNRAIDMTDLINAHCMKLSQSIFINLIGSGNHMTELA